MIELTRGEVRNIPELLKRWPSYPWQGLPELMQPRFVPDESASNAMPRNFSRNDRLPPMLNPLEYVGGAVCPQAGDAVLYFQKINAVRGTKRLHWSNSDDELDGLALYNDTEPEGQEWHQENKHEEWLFEKVFFTLQDIEAAEKENPKFLCPPLNTLDCFPSVDDGNAQALQSENAKLRAELASTQAQIADLQKKAENTSPETDPDDDQKPESWDKTTIAFMEIVVDCLHNKKKLISRELKNTIKAKGAPCNESAFRHLWQAVPRNMKINGRPEGSTKQEE